MTNETNFNEIYSQYKSNITNFVSIKINNSFDKDEIVQDIFLKISQNLHKYDSNKASIRTWIFTIVNNTIIDFFRTHKNHQTISVSDYLNDNGTENFEIESTDNNKGIETTQLQNQIAKCFDRLNVNQKEVAKLALLDGRKYREIAEILNIPMGSVKVTLMRAKNELRAMLKQDLAIV